MARVAREHDHLPIVRRISTVCSDPGKRPRARFAVRGRADAGAQAARRGTVDLLEADTPARQVARAVLRDRWPRAARALGRWKSNTMTPRASLTERRSGRRLGRLPDAVTVGPAPGARALGRGRRRSGRADAPTAACHWMARPPALPARYTLLAMESLAEQGHAGGRAGRR